MIEKLEKTLENFEKESLILAEFLQQYGVQGSKVAHRVGCCANDILSFAFIFIDTHRMAIVQLTEETKQIFECSGLIQQFTEECHAGQLPSDYEMRKINANMAKRLCTFSKNIKAPLNERDSNTKRLAVAYKAIYYFLRSFQDAAASALRVAYGDNPGQYTSMNELLKKPKNIAASSVMGALPEYESWFNKWKTTRDSIKRGISFGIAGPENNPGISFQNVTFDERGTHINVNVQQAVRLSDLIEALSVTLNLLQFINSIFVKLQSNKTNSLAGAHTCKN